ncbi:MAG: L-alanine-DL-glutamate epimerase, partial [Clostridia bacterium]|nr:L-alanine-DL-glutamate epimerase [Clostridia bacterium]
MKRINVRKGDLEFVREPLRAPFGFKGRYLTELWQTVAKVESDNFTAVCPCVESVLWSDAAVFGDNPPAVSSAMMMMVTGRALKLLEGSSFVTPEEAIGGILPELVSYAASVCGRPVAETFVLNSLVGVDFALWMLYAKENGITSFDGLIP